MAARCLLQTGIDLELIERLKKKQLEQQQALKELQEAMSLTSRCVSALYALSVLVFLRIDKLPLPNASTYAFKPAR